MLLDGPQPRATHRVESPPTKAEILKETLAKTLYDLVRAEQFVPFSILFASGQRFEIKTREHIGLDPVSRADGARSREIRWASPGLAWTKRGIGIHGTDNTTACAVQSVP